MRFRVFVLVCVAAMALPLPAMSAEKSSKATASNAAKDEKAVRSLFEQLITGWNKGSGDAFAAPFGKDAVFVAFDGTRYESRDEIATTHQKLFDTTLKGSRISGDVKSVRFIGEDVAVLRGEAQGVFPGGTEIAPSRNSMQVIVAVREAGRWRIKEFQNARKLTMETQLLLDDIYSLPKAAQHQVFDFVKTQVKGYGLEERKSSED
jgi:uncharacterized protein (TIGR02246 family)